MSDFVKMIGDILHIMLPNSQHSISFDSNALKSEAKQAISSGQIRSIKYALAEGAQWNSLTLATIKGISEFADDKNIPSDLSSMPVGVSKILALTKTTVIDESRASEKEPYSLFYTLGDMALAAFDQAKELSHFIGLSLSSLKRFFLGKAQYQRSDLMTFIQTTGPEALIIVTIVNLLLGVILAFMGAAQLKLFGAEIFVADLVALGHTREIAPMMTAIILAGRTGAAYAAQLGTMQVNEEIDALKTFGFSPMDFLVLPRMLALAFMVPLLVLYGDAVGIFGGFLIGIIMLDLGAIEYITQTQNAIGLTDIMLGVFKGSVFGVLVAITGCKEGIMSGRSASAVGDAATKAVVSGIVAIIVATAIFAVLASALGI